jgi:small subunit ribosomal protein S17
MAKKIIGRVTSDKQDKTIVVTETSRRTHPLYGKQYTRSRKYSAHDEKNEAHLGDRVQIVECRPISRHKSFTLERIIETGHEKIEIAETAEEKSAPKAKKVAAKASEEVV